MIIVLLLIVASYFAATHAEIKVWQPQGQSVDEWYSHPIQCPKTALVFAEDKFSFLSGQSHEKEIIFARTGYYIFENNAHFIIGDIPSLSNQECANAFGEQVTVHSVKPNKWADPNNWDSETKLNIAKPDIEKIPCDYDEVLFNHTVTRVDMSGIYQLQLKRVSIADKWLPPRDFGAFFKTVPGQKMFENSELVQVSEHAAPQGGIKACQFNTKYFEALVCESVSCAVAKCMNPIRPLGFCCPICGSTIQADVHHDDKNNLDQIELLLKIELTKNWDLFYHSSYFVNQTKFVLQITFADRGAYVGASGLAMTQILNHFLRMKLYNYVVLQSGEPFDPTARVSTFSLIFLPLLFVLAIFFGAYKLSYDDNLQINWRQMMNRVTGRSQFIFAQFENVLEDHEGRITISNSPLTGGSSLPVTGGVVVEETGVECQDSGMELVAGAPEDKKESMAKDKLDEIVETIGSTANDSVSLISVDM